MPYTATHVHNPQTLRLDAEQKDRYQCLSIRMDGAKVTIFFASPEDLRLHLRNLRDDASAALAALEEGESDG